MKIYGIPPQNVSCCAENREEVKRRINRCPATAYVAQGENVREFEERFFVPDRGEACDHGHLPGGRRLRWRCPCLI